MQRHQRNYLIKFFSKTSMPINNYFRLLDLSVDGEIFIEKKIDFKLNILYQKNKNGISLLTLLAATKQEVKNYVFNTVYLNERGDIDFQDLLRLVIQLDQWRILKELVEDKNINNIFIEDVPV